MTANEKSFHYLELPVLAGRRPMTPTGDVLSHVGLLRHFKRVINFDSEISNRTFELGMAE
jgi:hypothetical protein